MGADRRKYVISHNSDILSYANEAYGADDAIRWKKSKNEIESRTYSELKNDTDSFANAIEKLGKKGSISL